MRFVYLIAKETLGYLRARPRPKIHPQKPFYEFENGLCRNARGYVGGALGGYTAKAARRIVCEPVRRGYSPMQDVFEVHI